MSDLISRRDTIGACAYETIECYEARKAIRNLPSAEPKTGECEQCTYFDKLDYEAPRQGWCNQFEDWTDADEYCSRCAKMRGEDGEEE